MDRMWIVVSAIALAPFVITIASWLVYVTFARLRAARELVASFGPVVVGSTRRRAARVIGSTVLAWCVVAAGLTVHSPAAVVWTGGLVVATGCAVLVRTAVRPDFTFDEVELDLELRALLDEAA